MVARLLRSVATFTDPPQGVYRQDSGDIPTRFLAGAPPSASEPEFHDIYVFDSIRHGASLRRPARMRDSWAALEVGEALHALALACVTNRMPKPTHQVDAGGAACWASPR